MRIQNKAQGAVEFMLILSFFLLVFLTFIAVISSMIGDVSRNTDDSTAGGIIDILLQEIRQTYAAENGISKDFKLPKDIDGTPYTIDLNETILISYKDNIYSKALPPYANATNHTPTDKTASSFYVWNVRKEGGQVSLSQCTNCTYSLRQCLANGSSQAACNSMESVASGFKSDCCYGYNICCT